MLDPPSNWPEIMRLGVREWRNKSLKAKICKLYWSSAVYHLWRNQNDIRHGKPHRAEKKLLHYIAWDVKKELKVLENSGEM